MANLMTLSLIGLFFSWDPSAQLPTTYHHRGLPYADQVQEWLKLQPSTFELRLNPFYGGEAQVLAPLASYHHLKLSFQDYPQSHDIYEFYALEKAGAQFQFETRGLPSEHEIDLLNTLNLPNGLRVTMTRLPYWEEAQSMARLRHPLSIILPMGYPKADWVDGLRQLPPQTHLYIQAKQWPSPVHTWVLNGLERPISLAIGDALPDSSQLEEIFKLERLQKLHFLPELTVPASVWKALEGIPVRWNVDQGAPTRKELESFASPLNELHILSQDLSPSEKERLLKAQKQGMKIMGHKRAP